MSVRAKGWVLDAWAVLAVLLGEPPGKRVQALFGAARQGRAELWISSINLGEVYYRLVRLDGGEAGAAAWWRTIHQQPFIVDEPGMDAVLAAASLKSRHPLSYADAFAVELAMRQDATLVTGDPEILALPASLVRRRDIRGAN